jgi:hypothetical protein
MLSLNIRLSHKVLCIMKAKPSRSIARGDPEIRKEQVTQSSRYKQSMGFPQYPQADAFPPLVPHLL